MNLKRNFIPGDEWLYFKIYSGVKTLEKILINEIYPLSNFLLENGIIDKFFFIRYFDSDNHIRLRFHIANDNEESIAVLIKKLNACILPYIENRLVWDLSVNTYKRELERYGIGTMEDIETLFYVNSLDILSYINYEYEAEVGEDSRLLWCIKYIDLLLSKFSYSLNQKGDIISYLSKGYEVEFDMNKDMKIILDKKYREKKMKIEDYLLLDDNKNHNVKNSLEEVTISKIIVKTSGEGEINNLLSSIIHMHVNRLFRSKQRVYEFLILYMMKKLYSSMKIRVDHDNKWRDYFELECLETR
ncbi:thiopeptide-type bacteriocin biosynthesis protein [Aureibacter tunicatorum]|uniref:Thiopeptide-type bacteriocin biosynthesis protein n=1 Tax=Aureibacter tunicatorum TaxID=866807 RepID=A0AAE4BT19_9BACT|nr:thiopeptide-type bacteriocin biosynthesis protein [Aureibacter tunicatorum]MDR6239500.1 thiopeptide-type bacteriocin biosynthesis protein [Aureibacter tunicatorum]BDD04580.1 hypothetical protein AUTU_20630 [Aureibacter tunicatorum]